MTTLNRKIQDNLLSDIGLKQVEIQELREELAHTKGMLKEERYDRRFEVKWHKEDMVQVEGASEYWFSRWKELRQELKKANR